MKLIVNADDFGASHSINQAIVQAFQRGVLTSCSLMVAGDAFEEAVELARENPGLGVGLHLVAIMGKSVLPHSEIPHLVDARGFFSPRPELAGWRYYFSRQAREELRKEIAAQFARFHATGLPLSHVDGHLHLHVHPVIFREALQQAKAYGCRHMRVPVEQLGLALAFDRQQLTKKLTYSCIFGLLARQMKRQLRKEGFVFADRVYGNLQSGGMNKAYFNFLLQHLSAPANEIYFHPAVFETGQELFAEQRQLQVEYESLMDPEIKMQLAEHHIELVNYQGLNASQEIR
jgi:hopanoid biosynthesis associated protein HpnK